MQLDFGVVVRYQKTLHFLVVATAVEGMVAAATIATTT
jgi:hypothetical protein